MFCKKMEAMMKTLIMGLLLITNSTTAKSIFYTCYDAAFATGYVYENQFVIDLENEDSSDALYSVLEADYFSIVTEQAGRLTIKANLNSQTDVNIDLEYLNQLDGVKVACKYQY